MIDISTLGIKVDSSDVKRGKKDLGGLGKQAQSTEKKVSGATGKMNKGFKSSMSLVKGLATAMAAVGAVRFLMGAIQEQVRFQSNMSVINQLVKQTGASAWTSGKQLEQQARQIALATLESVEGVMDAQKTMLTFRNVTGESFDRAIVAATDMSAALGVDLKSATLQLGKALEDPVTGMTALTRSGTVFTQQQKDMVKEMVAAGEVAEAQKFILGELEAQYGGAGKAAAEGLGGSIDTLSQRWQEFKLSIMDGAIGTIVKLITDGLGAAINGVTKAMEFMSKVIKITFASLHVFVVRAGGAMDRLGETMRFALTNPLDFARGKIADFFEWLNGLGKGALELLGLDGIADRIGTNFDHIRGSTAAEHEKTLSAMKAATEREAKAVSDIYFAMFQDIDAQQKQASELTPSATGAAASPDGMASSGQGGPKATDEEGGDPFAIAAEKERLKWEGKFLSMQEAYLTELELIQIQEEEKKLILDNALLNEAITWDQHDEYLTKIEKEGAEKRKAIAEAEQDAKKAILGKGMSNLASLMNTNSKKMFEVGKKAAIAQAAVSGAQGVMEAWRSGMETSGPYAPLIAAAYAATAAVTAANNISKIRSQTFGGGGGGGSSPVSASQGASNVTPPEPPPEPPEERQEMRVSGLDPSALFTGEMVSSLAGELLEFQENGGRVIL